jgi:hypothetical protein
VDSAPAYFQQRGLMIEPTEEIGLRGRKGGEGCELKLAEIEQEQRLRAG